MGCINLEVPVMKAYNYLIVGVSLLIGLFSCKVSEKTGTPPPTDTTEVAQIDSIPAPDEQEIIEIKLYRGEQTRHFKLHHTMLEVSFDWEKQYLIGEAILILEPYFYSQSNLILDAKGFDIHEIALLEGDNYKMLDYLYDGKKLNIDLVKSYQRGEKLNMKIRYTAKPNEWNSDQEMRNTEKGLYFINPREEQKGKPMQIWTHGETDSNSRWFPTIDAPNQKSTQEMLITVDKKFTTLSNGTLIYSKSNPDSTRTDFWKMDKPHAPYLFMLAVGDFARVENEWNGKKVDYYVEKPYGQYADDIFKNTPEMLSYFSDTLNVPYPWDKYSQIVVRDFVSGAMENTTASVFMEDLNVDTRELIDYNWDDIIAHELFHQWFGNLVTCESWANLPLNESFATYGEYLWKHHKYGIDEAEYHLYEELESYLVEAESKNEDLIRFYYDDPDDLFDNHSYAKGGLILHALRNYVGDEAFFKSLEFYLKKHAFGKVEIHELRLAFEHICGEDLNWFFNQWFLQSGHPKLRIEESTNDGKFMLKIWQEQDIDQYPVYKLPLTLDIWENGERIQYILEIDQPYLEFEFEEVNNPDLVLVDSDFILVGEIDQDKTPQEYQFQFNQYPQNVRARLDALNYFLKHPEDSISTLVLAKALQDPFWVIREEVLQVFEKDTAGLFTDNEKIIKEIAMTDPNSLTKAGAIAVLASKDRSKYIEIFKSNLYDSSYSVAGQALYAYLQSGVEDVENVLDNFKNETNFNITSSIADYYIRYQVSDRYEWFSDKLNKYSSSDLWYFIKLFGMYLLTAPEEKIQAGILQLQSIALNHSQFYNRLSAYQSLELLSDFDGVPEILNQIKSKEKDSRLQEYFEQ